MRNVTLKEGETEKLSGMLADIMVMTKLKLWTSVMMMKVTVTVKNDAKGMYNFDAHQKN